MRFGAAALAVTLLAQPLGGQSRISARELQDVLPADTTAVELSDSHLLLSADGRRAYYEGAAGGLWMYDRDLRTTTRITDDVAWMASLSPTGSLIAYVKSTDQRREQH